MNPPAFPVKIILSASRYFSSASSSKKNASSNFVSPAPNVGEAVDSGLTAFITPAKTYSHKFTDAGVFLLLQSTSYNDRKDYCCSLCRVRPVEMFEISVSEELE